MRAVCSSCLQSHTHTPPSLSPRPVRGLWEPVTEAKGHLGGRVSKVGTLIPILLGGRGEGGTLGPGGAAAEEARGAGGEEGQIPRAWGTLGLESLSHGRAYPDQGHPVPGCPLRSRPSRGCGATMEGRAPTRHRAEGWELCHSSGRRTRLDGPGQPRRPPAPSAGPAGPSPGPGLSRAWWARPAPPHTCCVAWGRGLPALVQAVVQGLRGGRGRAAIQRHRLRPLRGHRAALAASGSPWGPVRRRGLPPGDGGRVRWSRENPAEGAGSWWALVMADGAGRVEPGEREFWKAALCGGPWERE